MKLSELVYEEMYNSKKGEQPIRNREYNYWIGQDPFAKTIRKFRLPYKIPPDHNECA